MKDKDATIVSEPGLLWERAEPAGRPAPSRLSRKKIVRAAIAIADRKGLAAVSLRNVGAALKAGPMRLYGYLSTKDELLDLMVDAVYAEIGAHGPIAGSWRDVLGAVAHRVRGAATAHPWFVELIGGRPHLGPGALAHLEMALGALNATRGFANIDDSLQAFDTLTAYVIGAMQSENSNARAEKRTGMDRDAWQAAWWPYLEKLIATGEHPVLAKIVYEANHPAPEVMFERGLQCVLDGIQRRILATGRLW